MSQDAHQKQELYSGYSGSTPQPSQPAPQEYYGTPEDPYGAPENIAVSASAYGTPPPIGASANPGAYNPPPLRASANPSAYSPPPYGYANQYQSQSGYGYQPPRSKAPLPFGDAIRALPGQYFKILTKPSSMTIAEEVGKASWDIVWFQLIIMSVLSAVFTFLAALIVSLVLSSSGSTDSSIPNFSGIIMGFSFVVILFMLILIPVGFFVGTGISYLIAKAFGGTGTFLEQCYTTILITMPTTILSALLSLIPFIGSLAGSALGIYSIILQIYALMAVHRVSGGKAAWIYFLPWLALAVVYVICFSVFLFLILHVR